MIYTRIWCCWMVILLCNELHLVRAVCRISDKTANCTWSELRGIPDNVPNDVTRLILGSNPIDTLSYRMLSRFTNLQVLDVTYCMLTADSFPGDIFTHMSTVKEVSFRRNRLRSLRPKLLTDAQVQVIRLDYNKFSHVPEDFLFNLPKLEKLTMSACDIQTISPKAFRSLHGQLKHIDLSYNMIEALHVDLRINIFSNHLAYIALHGNIWNCDCHLKWLREAVDNHDVKWYWGPAGPLRQVPICEEPKPLKHRSWFNATMDKFGCAPVIIPSQSSTVRGQLGEDIRLQCSVLTYTPPHSVRWVQNNVFMLDYLPRRKTSQEYNGSVFNMYLDIEDVEKEDYLAYTCDINTTYGAASQVVNLSAPVRVSLTEEKGIVAAIVVAVVIVVILLFVLAGCYIKKHLIYQGKLYTEADSNDKSEVDSVLPNDVRELVLNPAGEPDIIKCYPEDELDALPVETEYPVDDAGCQEYNYYLQTVKQPLSIQATIASSSPSSPVRYSPNHESVRISPAGRVNTPPRNSPLTYIREEVNTELL